MRIRVLGNARVERTSTSRLKMTNFRILQKIHEDVCGQAARSQQKKGRKLGKRIPEGENPGTRGVSAMYSMASEREGLSWDGLAKGAARRLGKIDLSWPS